MPSAQVDSGFMSGGIDDLFDDEDLPRHLAGLENPSDIFPALPTQKAAAKPAPPSRKDSQSAMENFAFQEVNPGPPELLPVTSIFNPAGKAKTLNKVAAAAKKPAVKTVKTSNPVSTIPRSEPDPIQRQLSVSYPMVPNIISAQLDMESTTSVQFQMPHEVIPEQEPISETPTDTTQQVMVPPQQNRDHAQSQLVPAPEVASAGATITAENPVLPTQPTCRPEEREFPGRPPVPASDPCILTLPPQIPQSEPLCPPSDSGEPPRYNKNQVKKQSIKDKLESAIQRGEMPPYCNNCGAIETPTWRKIWTQDHQGVPKFYEFSDKPGFVTTIDILERNSEGQPTVYRLVKKNLGPADDRRDWKELLLCNRKTS
jgi:hypothetical protein